MSAGVAIAIVVAVVVVLGAVAFLTLARRADVRGAGALSGETVRRDRSARVQTESDSAPELAEDAAPAQTREDAERAGELARYGTDLEPVAETAPVAWSPPDPEALAVSRRQFFNRATVTLMSASIGTFSVAAMVAYLWPNVGDSGFGGEVGVGRLNDILSGVDDNNGFFYAPEARTWITRYPSEALPQAREIYDPLLLTGMEAGIVALYQSCPHLGCRVPECETSQWFECGCHGSQYNRVGEYKAGPAPRGMDHFPVSISPGGDVSIDTGTVVDGVAHGVNTTGQEAEGPHCVGGGDH